MKQAKESQIEEMKNTHNNEEVVVVGNGPSLNETPIEQLGKEYPTIATNFINKIYSDTSWRPTYYVLTRILEEDNYQDVQQIISEGSTCFINSIYRSSFGDKDNIYYVDVIRGNDPMTECLGSPDYPAEQKYRWSDDITECIHQYNTAIFPAYQIAHYLGFKTIYLVGCDLGFDSTDHMIFNEGTNPAVISDPHDQKSQLVKYRKYIELCIHSDHRTKSLINGLYYFYKKKAPQTSFGEKFNFSEDYRNEKLYLGEDDRHRRAHNLANDKLTERNITVKNATLGGDLDVFPRCELANII